MQQVVTEAPLHALFSMLGGWDVDPRLRPGPPPSMCPRCVFLCVCIVSFGFGACSECTPQVPVSPVCLGLCVHTRVTSPHAQPVCLSTSGCLARTAQGLGKLCPWSGVPWGAPQPDLLPCSRDLCLTTPPLRIFPRDLPGLLELIGTRFSATRDVLGNSYL